MLGKIFKILLIIILFISNISSGNGQNTSSPDITMQQNEPIKIHSPHKATMYSALIPGLGQVYNKKYWKLPIIYGATGILIYAFDFNNDQYNKYKNAYADMDANKITSFEGYTSKDILLRIKDNYRRNRDLNVISLAAVYLLNVVDATVDAHLFDYEITDDLSLNIQPTLKQSIDYQNTYGLSLRITF
ncbi:DUF5683 domain-containing protein [Bacteroidota bacterium]